MRQRLKLFNSIGFISLLVFIAVLLTSMTGRAVAEREACPASLDPAACILPPPVTASRLPAPLPR